MKNNDSPMIIFFLIALTIPIIMFIFIGIKDMENNHFEKEASAEHINRELGHPELENVDFFVRVEEHVKVSDSYYDMVKILIGDKSYEIETNDLHIKKTKEANFTLIKVDAKFTKGKEVRERFDRYDLLVPEKDYDKLMDKKELQLKSDE